MAKIMQTLYVNGMRTSPQIPRGWSRVVTMSASAVCGATIYVYAKGEYQEPDTIRGSIAPLIDKTEVIGNVLRTQTGINPIYVSIGHRISLSTASDWALKLSPKYRLPETTRQADQLVKTCLKG